MPTFASVYRPPVSQQAFLTRDQKQDRKRKHQEDNGDAEGEKARFKEEQSSSEPEDDAPRVPFPVNRTDPYYVAGLPRDALLPGGDFPHASVKEPRTHHALVEDELGRLNAPLYVPKVVAEDQSGSLKRRHLDNLTAMLHKCMLNGDWKRASRIWGLILRTEVQGRGIDVRNNGRWTIGAELLMRRNETVEEYEARPRTSDSTHNGSDQQQSGGNDASGPSISDEGFKLARDYYERLILQYPHRQNAPRLAITALAIYPALFNVWIYEVQDRANRERNKLSLQRAILDSEIGRSPEASVRSDSSEYKRDFLRIKRRELDDAQPIATRMDELMQAPPYDTSSELIYIRGMLSLWLSNLHEEMSLVRESSLGGPSSEDDDTNSWSQGDASGPNGRHLGQAEAEREQAKRMFSTLAAMKAPIPEYVRDFLESNNEVEIYHGDT